jgi:penicillin-binding protein 1A
MALFDRFWRGSRSRANKQARVPAGFYPLYESMQPADFDEDDEDFAPRRRASGKPDFDAWDAKLAGIDDAIEGEKKRRLRWWQRDYWRVRSKWWWTGRGILAGIALFVALVGWLTVTAPLSKSLEPIAPPQVTLLASDGTPIARQGAFVEAPVILFVIAQVFFHVFL